MNQRSSPPAVPPARVAIRQLPGASVPLSRRRFLRAAAPLGPGGVGLLLLPRCAWAPPRPVPLSPTARIGVLSTGARPDVPEFEGLRRGLRELGYVEGQNIALEYRFAQGASETLPQLAAQLVALKVDVIVAHGLQACRAAKDATTTIPIVFGSGNDPVALGFVTSLARPGGNMTGVVHNPPGLEVKRLQLLKQACPGVSRVNVLINPANTAHARNVSDAQAAAQALGVQLHPVVVPDPAQVEAAFSARQADGPDGLLVLSDAVFYGLRGQITDLAAKAGLPGIFNERDFAQSGGLLAYGADIPENYRRAASYVDKILKGGRPADLPIEQPAKVAFVANLKTAEALGLTLAPVILEQVTEVIA